MNKISLLFCNSYYGVRLCKISCVLLMYVISFTQNKIFEKIGYMTEEGGSDARAPNVSILNFKSHILITVNGMHLIFL